MIVLKSCVYLRYSNICLHKQLFQMFQKSILAIILLNNSEKTSFARVRVRVTCYPLRVPAFLSIWHCQTHFCQLQRMTKPILWCHCQCHFLKYLLLCSSSQDFLQSSDETHQRHAEEQHLTRVAMH